MVTRDDNALQDVRRRHELRVLESLAAHGTRTRRELEGDTKLSRTTLSAIVGELRQRGIVTEGDQENQGTGRNGRPTKVLRLDPGAGAAVGVELGRRRVSISVIGFDGSHVAGTHRELRESMELEEKVLLAADMLRTMVRQGRVVPDAVVGMGVGIAARHANPQSLYDGDAPQQDPRGASLAPLREVVDAPLLWDNNIRLAAMAYGKADGDLLYVVLAAGIGSAAVVNGTLLRGGNGMAGELGHISVDFAGPACWCGRRGCLEQFLNEANVLGEAARRGQAFESVAAIAEAARAGNQIAAGLAAWAGELLARAVVSACVLLDPNRVVIAGELSQLGEGLLAPVRAALAEQSLHMGPRIIDVAATVYAPTAGSDGAAHMALKHWAMDAAR
ncbi:ROK family transcriptional regulator [Arthrobacter dokdonensis]|uniref:ROK family transcriptional regulator n=1 Tax=Arthrobacter dokdonellae TaxID=2211210 RepID=UPI0014944C6A|nr:ROK family transcriptional regulator [Arthrobacter dokdonellae]